MAEFKRVVVVGNIAGGKTRLAVSLGNRYQLPVCHIDSIQFLPGMIIRPLNETRKVLTEISQGPIWLIDGYGPLEMLEARFGTADVVVFVDLPIWRHFWWCTKRQIKGLRKQRAELPVGCNETSLPHTIKLYRTIWGMHKKMRPELLKIFNRPEIKNKMVMIKSLKEWERVCNEGLSLKRNDD